MDVNRGFEDLTNALWSKTDSIKELTTSIIHEGPWATDGLPESDSKRAEGYAFSFLMHFMSALTGTQSITDAMDCVMFLCHNLYRRGYDAGLLISEVESILEGDG